MDAEHIADLLRGSTQVEYEQPHVTKAAVVKVVSHLATVLELMKTTQEKYRSKGENSLAELQERVTELATSQERFLREQAAIGQQKGKGEEQSDVLPSGKGSWHARLETVEESQKVIENKLCGLQASFETLIKGLESIGLVAEEKADSMGSTQVAGESPQPSIEESIPEAEQGDYMREDETRERLEEGAPASSFPTPSSPAALQDPGLLSSYRFRDLVSLIQETSLAEAPASSQEKEEEIGSSLSSKVEACSVRIGGIEEQMIGLGHRLGEVEASLEGTLELKETCQELFASRDGLVEAVEANAKTLLLLKAAGDTVRGSLVETYQKVNACEVNHLKLNEMLQQTITAEQSISTELYEMKTYLHSMFGQGKLKSALFFEMRTIDSFVVEIMSKSDDLKSLKGSIQDISECLARVTTKQAGAEKFIQSLIEANQKQQQHSMKENTHSSKEKDSPIVHCEDIDHLQPVSALICLSCDQQKLERKLAQVKRGRGHHRRTRKSSNQNSRTRELSETEQPYQEKDTKTTSLQSWSWRNDLQDTIGDLSTIIPGEADIIPRKTVERGCCLPRDLTSPMASSASLGHHSKLDPLRLPSNFARPSSYQFNVSQGSRPSTSEAMLPAATPGKEASFGNKTSDPLEKLRTSSARHSETGGNHRTGDESEQLPLWVQVPVRTVKPAFHR